METSSDLFEAIDVLDNKKNVVLEKIMNVVFSNESANIQRTTDLSPKDLVWATKLEIYYKFIIQDYVFDIKQKRELEELKNSVFRIRLSKNKQMLDNLFSVLKPELTLTRMEDLKDMGKNIK